MPIIPLGFGAGGGAGAYSTANSATWTDIAGTTFTVSVPRPSLFEYRVLAAAHLSAAGLLGYVRGNIVNYDTTASILFGSTSTITSMIWYMSLSKGRIAPGNYTIKMQAATDNATFNITIDEWFHQFLLFAAA